MISIAIMAHPARERFIPDLLAELGDVPVIWDRKGSRWDTGRRAMLAHDPKANWHLVVQDDAILCREFLAGVERVLDVVPAAPVSFYTGQTAPHHAVVSAAVLAASLQRRTFLLMPGPFWGVAVAIPTDSIPPMLEACERSTLANYDLRIERYFTAQGIDCWYTVPSLVNHRVGPENPSLVPGRGNAGSRTAHKWIGQRSPLTIRWSPEPVKVSDVPVITNPTLIHPRGVRMARKRIADRRIYGYDRYGRHVLVAAPGQPVPDGYRIVGELPKEGAPPPKLISSMNVAELRARAKQLGLSTKGRKAELVARLEEAA